MADDFVEDPLGRTQQLLDSLAPNPATSVEHIAVNGLVLGKTVVRGTATGRWGEVLSAEVRSTNVKASLGVDPTAGTTAKTLSNKHVDQAFYNSLQNKVDPEEAVSKT